MRFALLGDDPVLVSLAEAAVAAAHPLTWIGETAGLTDELLRIAPDARTGEPWTSLVELEHADAVLASRGGDEDARFQQLRELLQADVPLLVVHPVCQSILHAYELDVVRRESKTILRHYNPARAGGVVSRLRELIGSGDAGPLGRVEQIVFERTSNHRSREAVLALFARDSEVLLAACGKPDRITALRAGEGEDSFAALAVQWTGQSGPAARWLMGRVVDEAAGTLSMAGSRGHAVIRMPDRGPWVCEADREGGPQQEEIRNDAATTTIAEFVAAIEHGDGGEDWAQAIMSLEVVDAAQRSLKKQKTISMSLEEPSEQGAFKSIMTAAGCGLLIAAVFLLVVVGIVGFFGQILGLPPAFLQLIRRWPLLLLGVLLAFLLLQAVGKLLLSSQSDQSNSAPPK